MPGGTGDPIGCAMQEVYFDYYLKRIGSPFPRVSLENISYDGKKYILTLCVAHTAECAITELDLWGSDNVPDYLQRKWQKVNIKINYCRNGIYKIEVSDCTELENMELFFLISDSRNVSVSSSMFLLRSQINGDKEERK